MYLTAHHVIAPDGSEGINAFYYAHGTASWLGMPPAGIPDENPGVLVTQDVRLPAGGNRVRSYLDVIAPDDAPWSEVRQSFVSFASTTQRAPFPRLGLVGRSLFRVGMELSLAHGWHAEMAELNRAVQAVRGVGPLWATTTT